MKINDIVISKFLAAKSSVMNQFPAIVHSINDPESGPFAIVELKKKAQSLLARVPRKYLHVLSLKEKETVFIQINNLTVCSER